jgi:hypothetical protein
MRAIIASVVGLFACIVVGCGAGPDRATVSGVVKYKDKGVPYGFIKFVRTSDPTVFDQGPIRNDGTYVLTNAPIGPVKVVLQINMAYDEQALAAKGEAPPENFLPADVAKTYSEFDTTPLQRNVEAGEKKMDFEIK